ncbi:hypothetical protein [Streptomyces anulatus]|uniref:hypothetical protein n=1 Tax=Streptomyces anulatus TaxID=1892 RepID=UPI0036BA84FA
MPTCGDCRRPVLWTITQAGKRLAVDPQPDPEGNAAVYRDGAGTYRSRRPSAEMPLMGWERLHVPHLATCQGRTPARVRPEPLPPGVVDLSAYRRKGRGRP